MRILKKILLVILAVIVAIVGYVLFAMRANVPEDTLALAAPITSAPSDSRPVLIFGATRNTGLEFARLLEARGERVVAFVRPTSDRSALDELDATYLQGDAMDLESVRAALQSDSFRAVVTTVGCPKCEPPVDFVANRNIIDAAVEAGVPKVLLITTIGSGNSIDSLPAIVRMVLGPILPLKTQAEEHLRSAPVTHIIIRPGGLGQDPATGTGILSENPSTFGFIDRSELATLMLSCIDHSTCDGKTLAAIDTAKGRPW